MRTCAKMRCGHEPVVTVSLSYGERQVVIEDLRPERDPNLLDLCRPETQSVAELAAGGLDGPRPPRPLLGRGLGAVRTRPFGGRTCPPAGVRSANVSVPEMSADRYGPARPPAPTLPP